MDKNHIKIAICDHNGILRSKYISKTKFESALENGMGFCDVIIGSDIDDQLIDTLSVTGWHSGYPDAHISIVKESQRSLSIENNRPFYLCEFSGSHKTICPRQILKKIKNHSELAGYHPTAGIEYEFTLFNENSDSIRNKHFQNLQTLTPGNFGYSMLRSSELSEFYDDLLAHCQHMNIPIEGLHTEIGPGVLEAAIEKSDILEAADRAIIFKSIVKTLAAKNGWTACFMARWSAEHQGQSGHIHLSMTDVNKQNIFFDPDAPYTISKAMKHFIGGQQRLMPELIVLCAPFVNSYTRLVPGYWAPTHANWGIDNRTCALRALCGSQKSQRVEYRIAGADSNPYLALSAALSSGLWGLENQIQPSEAISGNAYKITDQALSIPCNISDAVKTFTESEHAPLYYDEQFIHDYARTRLWEAEQYQATITDWQLARYFELA